MSAPHRGTGTANGMDGNNETWPKLIGAALVGTFFGVLVAYGIVGPMGKNVEAAYAAEAAFYMCIKVAIVNFARQMSPQMIAEFTRKHMPGDVKPSFQDAEEYLNKIGSGGEAKA